MADKKSASGAVAARRLAREKMTAALEARRKREEDNTKDLERFYVLDSRIEAAAAKLNAVIAAARAAHTETVAALHDEQGAALRSIRERSTPQAELLEMTGLTSGELQKLLKRAAPADTPAPTTSAAAPVAAAPATVTPIDRAGSGEAAVPADTAPPARADESGAVAPEALGAASAGSQ